MNLRSREECGICRSRQELSNEHLAAKIGVDTAENEPLKALFNFKLRDSIVAYPHRPSTSVAGVKCPLEWLFWAEYLPQSKSVYSQHLFGHPQTLRILGKLV